MTNLIFLAIFLSVTNTFTFAILNVDGRIKEKKIENFQEKPLILTPLIEEYKMKEAREKSVVHFDEFFGVKSYSGFLTVSKRHNSHMFFWFFPAETDYDNAPVILWLNGGPGASSLIGLFMENGPFKPLNENELSLRNYSWTKTHSVIYIDNPVGTGFSFTDDGYCRNETQVGLDLYTALQQFFWLFPELQKNDFFIAGESYAGKYVPAISYTILKKNPEADLKINLKGLVIGNGLCDPEHQLVYSDYLYQLGLIDTNEKKVVKQYEDQCVEYIKKQEWEKAYDIKDLLIKGHFHNTTVIGNFTGFKNFYNFLYTKYPTNEIDYMRKYVQREDVRVAIHVGNATFNGAKEVEKNLIEDQMQSVAPWISELLSNYRVLIYNGQLDVILAYPLTVNYLKHLNFNGADEYKTAERHQWYVGEELAGYVKQARNLTEVLVRNAGHPVPADQPKWAFDLISRFVRNEPYY